jgi:hypothetical protein
MMTEIHPFAEALEKFHGKIIEVKDVMGDCYRGKCIAINKPTLHIILEMEEGIIIIKNANIIRRDLDEIRKEKLIKDVGVGIKIETIEVEQIKPMTEPVIKKRKRKKKEEEK